MVSEWGCTHNSLFHTNIWQKYRKTCQQAGLGGIRSGWCKMSNSPFISCSYPCSWICIISFFCEKRSRCKGFLKASYCTGQSKVTCLLVMCLSSVLELLAGVICCTIADLYWLQWGSCRLSSLPAHKGLQAPGLRLQALQAHSGAPVLNGACGCYHNNART